MDEKQDAPRIRDFAPSGTLQTNSMGDYEIGRLLRKAQRQADELMLDRVCDCEAYKRLHGEVKEQDSHGATEPRSEEKAPEPIFREQYFPGCDPAVPPGHVGFKQGDGSVVLARVSEENGQTLVELPKLDSAQRSAFSASPRVPSPQSLVPEAQP